MNDSTIKWPKTRFFQACRGVFEGGGCRGAAHVGAYEAAIACGVNFSEVAGTSAGSIIAVLVAAGASPEYLLRTCAYQNFRDFLSQPKGRIRVPRWLRLLGLTRIGGKLISSIMRYGAAHSSEKLQEWMDERLAELLPDAERPIKFKSLLLPVSVLATDLAGRRAKIWSTEETPDESVALAVRCSCSIPFFFEPVEMGNDLFVDGGMLSNLPTFVFAKRAQKPATPGGRVLAFQLMADASYKPFWDISAFAARLIDAAISGATGVQGAIQANVSTVQIPTGAISSTDFDISSKDINFLLEAGRRSMAHFIANEHDMLNDEIGSDVARYGVDELYDDLVREMATPGQRLIISCDDTKWFWVLFPSLIHWLFAGASVDILMPTVSHAHREQQRLAILKGFGAHIVQAGKIPLRCFILSRKDTRYNAAFVVNQDDSPYAPTGSVYIGAKHKAVCDALLNTVDGLLGATPSVRPVLTLQRGDEHKLIDLLKSGVNQYHNPNVSIRLETLDVLQEDPSLQLIVRRIRSFKFRQVTFIFDLYARFGLPLGVPADILADGRLVSTITPPVVERWGDALIAVEGNSRFSYMYRNTIKSIAALVIEGVTSPLPGTPVKLKEALISTYQLTSFDRIEGFNYDHFRRVEGAVRPEN